MSRRLTAACLVVLVIAVVVGPARTPARAQSAPAATYIRPVAGFVVDHFRPPPSPYAAGNRGIDEVTVPGTPVVASSGGVVEFAGNVAGALHVTIRHPDGLRTTSSFLAVIGVRVGDTVVQGQVIGLSGTFFHFGVRDLDGTYLDPELLFAGRLRVHLVPGADEGERPLSDDAARSLLDQVVAEALARGGQGLSRIEALAIEVQHLDPASNLLAIAVDLERFRESQEGCTPAGTPAPQPASRHILVEVGGIGSSSENAAVTKVDTATLGYAAADVVRFSYSGGRVHRIGDAASGPLESLPETHYGPADTDGDLRQAADRLRTLLAEVARAEPGVPIDIVAHSQGGVITRLALDQAVAEGGLPAGLDTVVTLGSPHQGSGLATAFVGAGPDTVVGQGIAAAVDYQMGFDPESPAVAQLSEGSDVVAELARPVPAGVRFLSIGASGDLVVSAPRTVAAGATSVVVPVGGTTAHDDLPASAAVTREIALVRSRLGPACQSLSDGIDEAVAGELRVRAEAALGLGLGSSP